MVWSALAFLSLLADPALVAPDGTRPIATVAQADVIRNFASSRDGLGCVAFVCFEHSAVHAGWTEFRGFAHWCGDRYDGGGYPSKLRRLVTAYAADKGFAFDADVAWSQYEGSDPKWLEAALSMGELPAVTLSHSPRYGAQAVAHMVNCLHLDAKWGCSLDSNFGESEWRSCEDWLRDCRYVGTKYWAFTVHKK